MTPTSDTAQAVIDYFRRIGVTVPAPHAHPSAPSPDGVEIGCRR